MFTPSVVIDSIGSLINDHFGSIQEVESLLSPFHLNYIYNYPYEVVLYSIQDLGIDLIPYGKTSKDEYYIYDKNFNLILTIYTSDNIATSSEGLNYIANLKHGDYFHIVFKQVDKLKVLLVWVSKKLPVDIVKKTVSQWSEDKNKLQPTYNKTGQLDLINPYTGWLQVYYIKGNIDNNITASDILNNPLSELIYSTEDKLVSLPVTLNGWYGFFLIGEDKVHLLKLTNIQGIGTQKIYENNGLVYLSIIGDPQLPTEGVDRLSRNSLAVTAELDYALTYIELNNIATLNRKTVNHELSIKNKNSRESDIFIMIKDKNLDITVNKVTGVLVSGQLESIKESKTLIESNVIVECVIRTEQYIDSLSNKILQIYGN